MFLTYLLYHTVFVNKFNSNFSLKSVFDQYLYDYGTKWKGLSYITKQDARALMEYDSYDKVCIFL